MADTKAARQLEFLNILYCSPDSSVVTEADLPLLNGCALRDSIFTYLESGFLGLADAYIEGSNDLENAFRQMGQGLYLNMTMQKDELRAEYADKDIPESMLAWTIEKHVTIAYDTPRYITYLDKMTEYTGGTHGMDYAYGTTFDKETGQRVDESILKDINDSEFKALFQNELLKYSTSNDGNEEGTLEDYLLINLDELKLGNISLTDKSVIIRYQPYEIAAYAAGLPEVELTFDQVKPFLSQKGMTLIGD